jgi:orotate phosphoribosyltransferase
MEKVLTLLRDSGAMLEGHFLLSSGRHSNRYFQCARLLQYPDMAQAALSGVAEKIRLDMQAGKLQIDAVAGPAIGGIVVAYELGRQLGLPAFFTERDDTGTMALRRGFEVRPGQKILITEDVVTTGKSSGECAAVLQGFGAQIVALACIVDRRQAACGDVNGIEIPWPFYPACRIEAVNWEADSCELCKKGIPAVKPGSRKA